MNRKTKNTLLLIVILIFIGIGGGFFSFIHQKGEINGKSKILKNLKAHKFDTATLKSELASLIKKAGRLDSILALRKYNIPKNISMTKFYNFVTWISTHFSYHSRINMFFNKTVTGKNLNYYTYTIKGEATFRNIYKLIFAIEQSRDLKKITSIKLNNFVKVDQKSGIPHYLVSFLLNVKVYFVNNNRFASVKFHENRLTPNNIYNIFYPLIREKIPPNVDSLLDIQNAQLLALIPDGAYIADAKGDTYLLGEGDDVYLGYLTKIDYQKNEVRFIINKGGIIEKIVLKLK